MKGILVVAMLQVVGLGISAEAQATTAAEICQSFHRPRNLFRCQEIIDHHHMDGLALELCDRLSFNTDKLSCLETIQDKVYDENEIGFCSRGTAVSSVLQCLASHGKDHRKLAKVGSGCLNVEELLEGLKKTQLRLEVKDIPTSKLLVSGLIGKAENCLR